MFPDLTTHPNAIENFEPRSKRSNNSKSYNFTDQKRAISQAGSWNESYHIKQLHLE
jgi:hypothetical protein